MPPRPAPWPLPWPLPRSAPSGCPALPIGESPPPEPPQRRSKACSHLSAGGGGGCPFRHSRTCRSGPARPWAPSRLATRPSAVSLMEPAQDVSLRPPEFPRAWDTPSPTVCERFPHLPPPGAGSQATRVISWACVEPMVGSGNPLKPRPFASTLRPSLVPNLDPEGAERTPRGREGQRGMWSPGRSEWARARTCFQQHPRPPAGLGKPVRVL